MQQQESFEQYQTTLPTVKEEGGLLKKNPSILSFHMEKTEKLVEWRQEEKDRAVGEGVDE